MYMYHSLSLYIYIYTERVQKPKCEKAAVIDPIYAHHAPRDALSCSCRVGVIRAVYIYIYRYIIETAIYIYTLA